MKAVRRLFLSTADRNELVREAAAASPEECCGILLGRRADAESKVVEEVRPVPNTSGTDRRNSYAIDSLAVLAARERGRALGRDVVGFYHSHPDGSLRPSRRDRTEAWPGASYIIVSPRGGLTCWECGTEAAAAVEVVERRELGPGRGEV
jgi:proteasome lid subunit RPN8/RPN11